MAIDATILDGLGGGHRAKVNGEGELSVVVHPHPPRDEGESALPFRQYFTDDGTSSGASDMRVDGSTNSVSFYISAIGTRDIYIKSMSILISDASATLNKFGNLAALTTGCDVSWESQDEGTVVIADQLQTNFDLVRFSGGFPSFGSGASAFQAGNISGTSEGYLPFVDFSILFGLTYGIRLRKGTEDLIKITINDNVSTVDAFNCIGYGIKF